MLLLGVSSLLFLQGLEAWRSAGRRVGFIPDESDRGLLVLSVNPDEPAARGGLQAGDLILAVNGRAITHRLDYEVAAQRFERGRPVSLRVLRGGRILDLQVVPGVAPRWILLGLGCVAALGFLSVA